MTTKAAAAPPPAAELEFELEATADVSTLAFALLNCENPELLDRLLVLREQAAALYQRKQFHAALAAFQAACPSIAKSESGAQGRYRFAPLDAIIGAIRDPLAANGLAFFFRSSADFGQRVLSVTCTVIHIGGWFETSTFDVPIASDNFMNGAQHAGSASSYAKRYALCNALGLAVGGEDDDAQGHGDDRGGHDAPRQQATTRGKAAVGRAAGATQQPPAAANKADLALDDQILAAAEELGYDAAKVRKWVNQKFAITTGLTGLTPHDKREVLKIFREHAPAKKPGGASSGTSGSSSKAADSVTTESASPPNEPTTTVDDEPELEPAGEPKDAISKGAQATLRSVMTKAGLTEEDFHDHFGFGLAALRSADVKRVHEWIKGAAKK